MEHLEKTIARTFLQMAEGLERGSYGPRPRIALTGMGSEHGEENAMAAAQMAAAQGVDVIYIGTLEAPGVTTVRVDSEEEGHKKMDELLEGRQIEGAHTMHYPFPIGVSTVGRAVTPGRGREMFVANTTGTTSTDRVEGMVKNAVCGIIAAKACGVTDPTVGILNVDGARQVEMTLNKLREGGYSFRWAKSARTDGGAVLRGNDVLLGTPDVLVTDSLTGNVLIKMLSAFVSGGTFEATGFGYGPGIGPGYDKLVLIVSRASGAPLIANALLYAGQLVRGGLWNVAKDEYEKAERAGLSSLLEARKGSAPAADAGEVQAPPAEPVTASIPGVDVMDLEDAVKVLWRAGIYAESGMGCTGPLVMMSPANLEKAKALLQQAGYLG